MRRTDRKNLSFVKNEKTELFLHALESGMGRFVIQYRWWIILASILSVVAAGAGIQFLTFNNDLRVFFSEDNPQMLALDSLNDTYAKSDSIMFVVAPASGNVFTSQNLETLEKITEQAWLLPYATRVESLTNYQHAWMEGDDLFVENLISKTKDLSDAEISQRKMIALSEPELVNMLVSPSGHVAAVFVNFVLPNPASEAVDHIALAAQKLADQLEKQYPNITMHITGEIMLDYSFGRVSQDDMTTLLPAMFLVIAVVLALFLGSITGTLSVLCIIVVSLITGMGVVGWMGKSLNPASSNAPLIILTLAVAGSIHILVALLHHMRNGMAKDQAIMESLRLNVCPIFLTSITTGIGFLTMNFSDAPPFRDLGNMVAIGSMVALGYTLFLLPALMTILPVPIKPSYTPTWVPLDWLANFVISKHSLLLFSSILVAAVSIAGVFRIEFGDNWIKYFDERYEFRTASDFAAHHLTGMWVLDYSLESGESGGIHDPQYLTSVDDFTQWFRKQPKVTHVTSISDTMKRLNKTMHAGDQTFYHIPQERSLIAQYLLLFELSLPFGQDLNNRINIDKSASRMSVFLNDITTKELRELEANAWEWARGQGSQLLNSQGTGLGMVWAHLSERNISFMLQGAVIALILISALLVFALRSVKFGLVSLIPNLAPAFVAFGLWGMLVGQAGLGLSVVVSLTLGIVVDDTIHFMIRYLRGRREQGKDASGAIRYAFNTVGPALFMTSFILIAGFLVLTLSGYRMNAEMGLLSAITIGIALCLDFLLLPAVLLSVDGRRSTILSTTGDGVLGATEFHTSIGSETPEKEKFLRKEFPHADRRHVQ